MMNNFKIIKNTEWKDVEINGAPMKISLDWSKKNVSDFVISKGDLKKGPFGSSITKSMFVKSGIKVYEQKNAIQKDFNLGKSYVSNSKAEELIGFKVEPGDFIMSCAGTIGELYKLPSNAPIGIINQALIKMKISEQIINHNYFQFLFKFDSFRKGFSSDGGIIINFNLDTLRKVECGLPPLPQQSSITTILSAQESIINDMETLVEKYETRLRYLSEELLSGRLRIKEVEGETIFYKNKEWKEVEINGEIKEIPLDWEVDKISDIFEVQRGSVLSKDYIKNNIGIYPVYSSATENNGSIGNIKTYMFDGEFLTWTTDGVYAGTVFYRSGRFNCTNICGLLKIKDNEKSIKGISYFVKKELIKHVNHIGNSKLMSNTVSNVELVYASQKELFLISGFMNKKEELIETQKKLLEKEKQKFNFLLNSLLSGNYLVESVVSEI